MSEPKKRRSLLGLIFASIGMFGFAFALVPLYDVFCDITGINGKTASTPTETSERIDTSREVTVEFVAYINPGVRWQFTPQVKQITVHLGETKIIKYDAKNLNKVATIGQAVPSVTPGVAAKYFNKIECFCFNHQPLEGGENAELPLVFYIDPDLPKEIETLTLAYTLFNVAMDNPTAEQHSEVDNVKAL
ncbi:cytochrome c oxidase assembly protein [Photobacterium leiognathi]|uniref:cytochrome c oxidase assembly protein n=1 Tax=Photobacterium leiognathi TaxID=553611 RepID=UPI0027371063|nr:cytochrome c oxidase assembly protein [Photobacterium leiognathi]